MNIDQHLLNKQYQEQFEEMYRKEQLLQEQAKEIVDAHRRLELRERDLTKREHHARFALWFATASLVTLNVCFWIGVGR